MLPEEGSHGVAGGVAAEELAGAQQEAAFEKVSMPRGYARTDTLLLSASSLAGAPRLHSAAHTTSASAKDHSFCPQR